MLSMLILQRHSQDTCSGLDCQIDFATQQLQKMLTDHIQTFAKVKHRPCLAKTSFQKLCPRDICALRPVGQLKSFSLVTCRFIKGVVHLIKCCTKCSEIFLVYKHGSIFYVLCPWQRGAKSAMICSLLLSSCSLFLCVRITGLLQLPDEI